MRCYCITSIPVDIPDTERSLPTGNCWPLVGEIILTVCNFVLRDDVGGVDGDDGDDGDDGQCLLCSRWRLSWLQYSVWNSLLGIDDINISINRT